MNPFFDLGFVKAVPCLMIGLPMTIYSIFFWQLNPAFAPAGSNLGRPILDMLFWFGNVLLGMGLSSLFFLRER